MYAIIMWNKDQLNGIALQIEWSRNWLQAREWAEGKAKEVACDLSSYSYQTMCTTEQ